MISLKHAAVFAALCVFLAFPPSKGTQAQTRHARPVQRALALAVAKVCANEAGFNSPSDCALIWQVVQNHHPVRAQRQLAWLRSHSRRVLGNRTCRRGNCFWSRNLTRQLRAPMGWSPRARWRRAEWQALLELADGFVSGAPYDKPCEGAPITWGGPMDHRGAVLRGLVPLRCTGTHNTGYERRALSSR